MTEMLLSLENETVAVDFSVTKFGVSKSLSKLQVHDVARGFGADDETVSASKRLFPKQYKPLRKVTSVQSAARAYWKMVTIPYPEPGIRLMRRSMSTEFNEKMEAYVVKLEEGITEFNADYDKAKEASKKLLGDLYNEADYPSSMTGLFQIGWSLKQIAPPDYLKQMDPKLYEAEVKKMQARFAETATLTQAMFAKELAALVESLSEKLKPNEDGDRRVIRVDATKGLLEFFQRFDALRITSDADLDALVGRARDLMNGTSVSAIKDSAQEHKRIQDAMQAVGRDIGALIDSRARAFDFTAD